MNELAKKSGCVILQEEHLNEQHLIMAHVVQCEVVVADEL